MRFGVQQFFERMGQPRIVFKLWDNFSVGSAQECIGTVTFRNRKILYKLLFSGEVAFGDGYSAGSIDIDGNLVDMLVESNVSRYQYSGIQSSFLGNPFARFRPSNTLGRAQKNIHHHLYC